MERKGSENRGGSVCVCVRERVCVTKRVQIRATEKAMNEKVKGRKRE